MAEKEYIRFDRSIMSTSDGNTVPTVERIMSTPRLELQRLTYSWGCCTAGVTTSTIIRVCIEHYYGIEDAYIFHENDENPSAVESVPATRRSDQSWPISWTLG